LVRTNHPWLGVARHRGEEGRELSRAWEGGSTMGVKRGDGDGTGGDKDGVNIQLDSMIPKSSFNDQIGASLI
jgi:hypothetical protein